MTIAAKQERDEATNAHMEEVETQLLEVFTEDDASKQIRAAYNQLMKEIVREDPHRRLPYRWSCSRRYP